mmetsp:Transcript_26373/g.76892  ORF Transcript_26373/g.76892 Transcript_26373/m.76892 type:complete len:209 (-) Transcript_26373:242-868(-)|eukprot:CAMPEP_0118993882 /NCGR_PEP_ID=MMETSP1173-20130426/55856_1 /TAXON_ID=1034831 /ORGANISM="Rhizochromulina marina cf, Strain CCMP1243" /LENGTH=208 /DNA_ID=CAMNT_0006945139 /DNA_START=72 /DNA_END=698 /DNA_ORIENTATION=+
MADYPSSSGFRNLKPLTRGERLATKDKVALEKDRLMKRTGLSARMYRENAPMNSMGLTCPEPTAAGYLADADRFHTDVSGEEWLQRKREYQRKQEIYASKREHQATREEDRWQRIQEAKKEEELYWQRQRELGQKSKKNSSCVPYNTISLKYDAGERGDHLRHQDDLVRYRAALRSQNLMVCGDSRVSYDIINGEGRPVMGNPQKPEA